MSVPPQIIQVKRKRNDHDGPVTFLRIEQNTKRHRSGAFLYRRHDPEAALESGLAHQREAARPPAILSTRPGEENLPFEALKRARASPSKAALPATTTPLSVADNATTPGSDGPAASVVARPASSGGKAPTMPRTPPASAVKSSAEPRRFHLSRNSYASDRGAVQGSRITKMPSTKASPALFVERTKRRRISPKVASTTLAPTLLEQPPAAPTDVVEMEKQPAPEPFRPKRPNRQRGAGPAKTSTSGAPRLPDSFTNRWDADMDQLARDMDEYALQHIAQDLQRIKDQEAAAAAALAASAERKRVAAAAAAAAAPTTSSMSPQAHKFKPHAPKKRYPERHPDAAAAQSSSQQQQQIAGGGDVEMGEGGETDSDDGDAEYVIDTYVRVAADSVGMEVTPEKMGLLVLDEPDVDFFYGEASESEDEFEDDDDENAENYYTADYPDDEVNSDDEFNRNAYLYSRGADEFNGDDDDSDSDAERSGGRFQVSIGRQPLPRF